MARVVPRRSAPPYLLIIFVFLFVVTAIVAFLVHMQKERASKDLAAAEETLARLATKSELAGPDMAAMMRRAETPPRKTVVRQQNERIEQLGRFITNDSPVYTKAVEEHNALLGESPTGALGLLPDEIRQGWKRQDALKKAVEDKDRELAGARQERDEEKTTVAKLQADLKAKGEELAAVVAAREQAVVQTRKDLTTRLENAQKEYEKTLAEKDATIATLVSGREQDQIKIQELNAEMAKLNALVQEQKRRIVELETRWRHAGAAAGETPKGEEVAAVNLGLQPDGRIMKVVEDESLCYIDIGSKDGVKVGQTFAVYPRAGIPATGVGKANLIVVNADTSASRCRIVKVEEGVEGIFPGDLVANIAFDRDRTYTFVVKGLFSLYGTAPPSTLGTDEVKAIIRRSGGRIVDDVTVNTDFAVLGVEPRKPPEPSPGAGDSIWQAYRERLGVWQQFQEIKKAAMGTGVQILNTNRFLAFTGYTPQQTLEK
jgi:hypothetical protein